jgi:DNA-binding MarR family transcriptional regulator
VYPIRPTIEHVAASREANLLGALALGVADEVAAATADSAAAGGAAPAALVALHEFLGGRTMDELRSAIGLTHSGAVRLVDRLADTGLVERRPGADGRTVAVVLTPRGRRAAQRTMAARAAVIDELLDRLAPAERTALVPLLERLVGAVTERRLAARLSGRPPTGGWLCRLCDFAACGRPGGRCPTQQTAAGDLPTPTR